MGPDPSRSHPEHQIDGRDSLSITGIESYQQETASSRCSAVATRVRLLMIDREEGKGGIFMHCLNRSGPSAQYYIPASQQYKYGLPAAPQLSGKCRCTLAWPVKPAEARQPTTHSAALQHRLPRSRYLLSSVRALFRTANRYGSTHRP
jgi:hypothetical protein